MVYGQVVSNSYYGNYSVQYNTFVLMLVMFCFTDSTINDDISLEDTLDVSLEVSFICLLSSFIHTFNEAVVSFLSVSI